MVLFQLATTGGDPWRIVTVCVFGVAMVLLYAASTCYHACAEGPRKRLMRVIDHAAIYVLIAGTYTPFMLVMLRRPLGLDAHDDFVGAGGIRRDL